MIRGINILTTSNHQIHDMDIYNHRRKFRSLEAKLPTISRPGRSSARKKLREGEDKKVRRENMQVREKVGKSRNAVFFPIVCGSGGLKRRLAKAAGAETSGQMRNEKVHAVVSRSTFGKEKCQNVGLGPLLEVEMFKKWTPL